MHEVGDVILNSKTYLKWTCILVPLFISIIIGATYFSYKTLVNANPTGVIEPGTLSMELAGYTALVIILFSIYLIGWILFGLILMLRALFTKIIRSFKEV